MKSQRELLLLRVMEELSLSFKVTLSWAWKSEQQLAHLWAMWGTERTGFQAEWSKVQRPWGCLWAVPTGMFLCMHVTVSCSGRQVAKWGCAASQNGEEMCESNCDSAQGRLSVCTIQHNFAVCQVQYGYNQVGPGPASGELSVRNEQSAQCETCNSRGLWW